MSKFESLVAELTRDAGLEVSASVESPLDITVDDMTVTLSSETHYDVETIVFFARLGEIQPAYELPVYRLLLEANVLWSATSFATLGVNSATREAIICYRYPAEELTGENLALMLSGFIEIARNWRTVVVEGQANGTAGSPSDYALQESMIRI